MAGLSVDFSSGNQPLNFTQNWLPDKISGRLGRPDDRQFRALQEVWSPELHEMLSAVPEPRNIVDKYAVSVQRDGEVVGHLMKGKSGVLRRQFSIFCMPIRRTTVLLW